jgi:hypothetical protein
VKPPLYVIHLIALALFLLGVLFLVWTATP